MAHQQLVEPRNMPPAPGLAGSTLRQVIHTSTGGPMVRVRFSNAFGSSPLAITTAHIARSRGGDAIDVPNDPPLHVGGAGPVAIPPRATATFHALEYDG